MVTIAGVVKFVQLNHVIISDDLEVSENGVLCTKITISLYYSRPLMYN